MFRDFSLKPPNGLYFPQTDEDTSESFTGERFIPGYADGSVELEHVHRYLFALQFVSDARVLDIACGEGYGTKLLSTLATHVTGVDIDAQCVERAATRYADPKIEFLAGSATKIPSADHSFDVLISFETLEHLDDQDAFWAEALRVLKPDGLLVLSSPNRTSYRQNEAPNIYHVKELTRDELIQETARRFAHYRIYDQQVIFGSQILPNDHSQGYWKSSLERSTSELAIVAEKDRLFPYSIVIASQQPIATAGPSSYTGHYPPGAMSALIGGIAERDNIIQSLRREISDLSSADREMSTIYEISTNDANDMARLRQIIAEKQKSIEALQELLERMRS